MTEKGYEILWRVWKWLVVIGAALFLLGAFNKSWWVCAVGLLLAIASVLVWFVAWRKPDPD